MTEPFPSTPSPPLYQAVPVLEAVDEEPAAVLQVADEPTGILDALPSTEPPIVPRRESGVGTLLRVIGRIIRGGFWTAVWLLGAVSLMVGLAVLAALPVLQFLSLGYLLESGGRIARTGRIRDGFIGVYRAALLGVIVLGSWLLLLPVRIVTGFAQSAQIIDPGGRAAIGWRIGLFALIGAIALLFALIFVAAVFVNARFRRNDQPRRGYYAEARDAVWDLVVSLRLPYYFWLGFRGFVGAMAWLIVPITLIALGRLNNPVAPLFGFFGAFVLAIVLLYLPFLQMRLAKTNRLSAVFGLRAVRTDFKRAPWASAFALIITLLFAIPLYLLKIEIVPREAEWLPSLVFIIFIFPARLLTGWALGRAGRRTSPRHWFFRWTGRLPLLPATAIYVLIVFFTQYTSWNGVWSLYEQHAFLVPVPFFGM
jgi:hypothetical protein